MTFLACFTGTLIYLSSKHQLKYQSVTYTAILAPELPSHISLAQLIF